MDLDSSRTVTELGDELYGLPPSEFTAARDGMIATARNAGRRDVASALAKLKRPSVAAWLVNLLALRRTALVAELIELGAAIQAAQGNVPPTQLRDLSAQRRRQLDALLTQAQSLAAELGQPPPSRAHQAEAEATLAAAMADPDAAALVRSARVVKPLAYSGFGQPGDAMAGFAATAMAWAGPSTAAPEPAAGRRSSPTAPPVRAETGAASEAAAAAAEAERQRRAEAAARAEAAKARVSRAEQALAQAEREERAANESVTGLTDQIAQMRQQLDAAQREARLARERRLAAEREFASAQRRLQRES